MVANLNYYLAAGVRREDLVNLDAEVREGHINPFLWTISQ